MSTGDSLAHGRLEHELRGLDGVNMLAFMAALGALRVLDADHPAVEPTLRWELRATWTPILACRCERDTMIDLLHRSLRQRADLAELNFADNIKQTAEQFGALVEATAGASSAERRERLGWLAAFVSEACKDPYSKEGILADTALRTMQGASHEHFLKSIRFNLATVDPRALNSDLFEIWTYDAKGLPLRWDPVDDRRHAYRWKDPSGDQRMAVLGALALAGAAVPIFTVAPQSKELRTLGFGTASLRHHFTWPLWEPPLSARAVRSLLGVEELHATTPDRSRLAALGIAEVRRSLRIKREKSRNFSPSWSP